jgi:hypothetical protein
LDLDLEPELDLRVVRVIVGISIGRGIGSRIVIAGFWFILFGGGPRGATGFILLHPIDIICILCFEVECTQHTGFATPHDFNMEAERNSAEVLHNKGGLIPVPCS